jgi:hypothetical protein
MQSILKKCLKQINRSEEKILNMALPTEQPLQSLYTRAVSAGLKRNWHLCQAKGKFSQSLLVHGLNTLSIGLSLAEFVEGLSERQKRTIAIGCFLHDAGKAKPFESRVTPATRGIFPAHQGSDIVSDDEFEEMIKELGVTDKDMIKDCIVVARTIENPQTLAHIGDMLKAPISSPELMYVASLADELASLNAPNSHPRQGSQLQLNLSRLGLSLYSYRISTIRGVLTQLLHKAMVNLITKRDARVISIFPSGILFVSKSPIVDPSRDELVDELKRVIKAHLEKVSTEELAAAAFGSVTGTVLVAPDFIINDPKVMLAFWEYIAKQNFVSDPKMQGEGKEKWISAIHNKYKLDEKLVSEKFKTIRATQYLTQIFKEAYQLSDTKVTKSFVVGRLSKSLSLDYEKAERFEAKIQGTSQTCTTEKCINLFESLMESPVLKKLRRREFVRKIVIIYRDLSVELVKRGSLKAGVPLEEIVNSLINELDEPTYTSLAEVGKTREKFYNRGKAVGGISCACCSKTPNERAAEALIGEGTEIFTNFVRGGTNLGNENKAKICELCAFEAKLRRIQIRDSEEAIYVFPQVQTGQFTVNAWAEMLDKIFTTAKYEGIPSLKNANIWAEIVLEGNFDEKSENILTKLRSGTKGWRIGVIKRYIEQEYGTDTEGISAFLENCEHEGSGIYNSVDELANAIANGVVKPAGYLAEKLGKIFRESVGASDCYESPNYVLFLLKGLRQRLKDTEEAETAYFIRRMFIGLILARLFLASVSLAAVPLEIKSIPVLKGYLEVPRKIGLIPLYNHLHISEWVSIEQLDKVLQTVASLISIESHFRERKVNIGKDGIYTISKDLPGRVLNRYAQNTDKWRDKKMFELLEIWSEPRSD